MMCGLIVPLIWSTFLIVCFGQDTDEYKLFIECTKESVSGNLLVNSFFKSDFYYLLYSFEWTFSDGNSISRHWGKKSASHVFSNIWTNEHEISVSVSIHKILSHQTVYSTTKTIECYDICEPNTNEFFLCLGEDIDGQCCKGTCCEENNVCLEDQGLCCMNEQICGENCCEDGESCITKETDMLCCKNEHVIDGSCCTEENICGEECCSSDDDQVCISGSCCANDNVCGIDECCLDGQECVDGQCCDPSSICDGKCCSGYCCVGECVRSELYCCHDKNGEEVVGCEAECCGKLNYDICCSRTRGKCRLDHKGNLYCNDWLEFELIDHDGNGDFFFGRNNMF